MRIHSSFYITSLFVVYMNLRGTGPHHSPPCKGFKLGVHSDSQNTRLVMGQKAWVWTQSWANIYSGWLVLAPGQSPLDPFYQHWNLLEIHREITPLQPLGQKPLKCNLQCRDPWGLRLRLGLHRKAPFTHHPSLPFPSLPRSPPPHASFSLINSSHQDPQPRVCCSENLN